MTQTTEKYADLVNRQWDDLPEIADYLPVGTWLLKSKNVAYFPGDEDEDKSARVVFFYEAKEPMDDVSAEELEALGGDYDFSNNDIAKQFYINRDKDWVGVKKHIELHGVDTKGLSMPDSFKAFRNTEVMAYLGTRTYKNRSGESVTENDPSQFARVE
jgi:hypothetical protein